MKGKIAVISALTVGAGGTAVATTKASGPIGRIFSYSSQTSESLVDRWSSGSSNTSGLFTGRTDQKNNINLTEESIRNSHNSRNQTFNLEINSDNLSSQISSHREETLNLMEEGSLELGKNKGVLDFLGDFYQEIGKTSGTSGVAEEMKQKIQESLKKLKDHKENFRKASSKVDKWSKNFEVFKTIQTGNFQDILQKLNTENIDPLTVEEKKSLKEFYKEFFSLVKAKKELIQKVSEKNENFNRQDIEEIKVESEKVLEALDYINWEEKNLETRAKNIYDKTFNNRNLLSYLMTEEEGKLLQKTAIEVQRSINHQRDGGWLTEGICTFFFVPTFRTDACYGDLELLNSKKVLVTTTLDHKVASKLLFDMKRVEKVLGFKLF
ncbi:hypothetical protein [Mycoplasma suis]|uniref:Uncharacterized protein n=1 Tax=Mycoplasma suis (strain Illinois) TaxID=768700 RepID=F0QQ38_MYCSL|nr:hypothetical protein [Mycoplasma suis]ADX97608.1 hypothetical protein MSU_0064 [Mycoplasma suis str. Illinois]